MSRRHGVGAEDIRFELSNKAFQKILSFFMLQIDSNSFFTEVGSDKVAVAVFSGKGTADVAVGVSFGLSA
jgi:hypothetical protein